MCNCRNSTALCLYLLPLFSLCTFQTSPLSQESLSIIPRRRSFVKSFFYFFQKNFFLSATPSPSVLLFFTAVAPPLLATTCLFYHTYLLLSIPFFIFLQKSLFSVIIRPLRTAIRSNERYHQPIIFNLLSSSLIYTAITP